MPASARAAVFHQPQSPLELHDFPLPSLSAGEVLVDITMCTLCGSDLHTYFGRRSTPMPTILGHEIIGTVSALGPGEPVLDYHGRALRPGQRVTWTIAASCGGCYFCTHGLPQKCTRLVKYGHEKIRDDFALSGGLASSAHLKRGTAILPIPAELPDAVACPANCATATVAAALRLGECVPGEIALVHGAGMLGLAACAMLHTRGVAAIVVCDPHADRRERALTFGATHALPPEPAELTGTLRALSAGRGADVAIELSGQRSSVQQQLDQLRIGGRCILVGTTCPMEPVPLDPERVTRSCLTIRGLHNYTPADLACAVDFLAGSGRDYPFAALVERTFPLEEATAAFHHAELSRALRIAVRP